MANALDLLIGILIGLDGIYIIYGNNRKLKNKKLEEGQKTDLIEDYFVAFFLLVLSAVLIFGKFSIVDLFK